MVSEEVLKAVFPLLDDGKDLASCMLVCKQWREIARDDYLWKGLCAQRWPSICKKPPAFTFFKLYSTFYKRQSEPTLLPPKLSFEDLDFYIDIWSENLLLFSEVVSGAALKAGIKDPPMGITDMLRFHLAGPDYKMTLPVEPRFKAPISQRVSVSVLVGRRDSKKVACIINKAVFGYIDRTSYRALAFDYLDFSPAYPFVSRIRAWISLLLTNVDDRDDREGDEGEGEIDVFGIEMDFCDAANSEREVLWLLDMLDWK